MNNTYAKVIVKGSPISKSNFKLFNINGRAILPYNSGKYHDRYALYEEEIAYETRSQNPGIVLSESLIAILKVYYKSKKRHPDTNNITKSIFDGIEKSGLIVNDAQIRRIIVEEFYDEENPRFELELFGESTYEIDYEIRKKPIKDTPLEYSPPSNKKRSLPSSEKIVKTSITTKEFHCEICNKAVQKNDLVTANKGATFICKNCLKNLF
ncbi:RusA family crossover junction endodeoxyribonuclease [Clostridium sp. DJ247]|uniref:RusA family crossover junction endodeoxyribonuclease n=1 Tax=Clostridium sp. DJ247 TaxID=2726188 RepID=UPI001628E255|nr:RusA family crossover junction endodeoxyribonuclease [Clostridium sp. DJ247]MBC2579663.1 RusA family crossover junction endodeoxyribonuclease [Clostridium sp. DJ247]